MKGFDVVRDEHPVAERTAAPRACDRVDHTDRENLPRRGTIGALPGQTNVVDVDDPTDVQVAVHGVSHGEAVRRIVQDDGRLRGGLIGVDDGVRRHAHDRMAVRVALGRHDERGDTAPRGDDGGLEEAEKHRQEVPTHGDELQRDVVGGTLLLLRRGEAHGEVRAVSDQGASEQHGGGVLGDGRRRLAQSHQVHDGEGHERGGAAVPSDGNGYDVRHGHLGESEPVTQTPSDVVVSDRECTTADGGPNDRANMSSATKNVVIFRRSRTSWERR